jgi:hypothetical protein
LQLDPTQDEVLHNLAIAHAQGGRWQAAGEFCERALAIRPDAWRARLMRGMTRIALGSFADGWDDYEARGLGHDGESERFGLPTWEGPGDAKRSIAVVPEQGVGTQILFASCVADLAARVPNVTLGCEPRLVGLLRRSLPGVHVVAGSLLPMLAKCDLFDCQIKAGSLPRVFRRSAEAFPGVSYLAADPGLKTGWQARLDSLGPGLKVGVSWGGGARKSDASHRHTDPTAWRRLAEVAGVHWINLQYDTLAEERAAWQRIAGERFYDWNDFDKKFDLENLVALVSELDLVITVVNSNVQSRCGRSPRELAKAASVVVLLDVVLLDLAGRCAAQSLQRREVGRVHVDRLDLVDDLSAGFGFVARLLPGRVVDEGVPICLRGLAARVGDDVDQRVVGARLVGRRPIGDVLDSVLLE